MENTKTYLWAAQQSDLFTKGKFFEYIEATTTQRFLNYLIDNLLMQFFISWATRYLLVNVLAAFSLDTAYALLVEKSKLMTGLLIGSLNFLFYYTICEAVFRGYTVGKFATGTKAIREDGNELTFKDALVRSLCRLVPLEAVSIWLGYGLWHDVWSKTRVIKTRQPDKKKALPVTG
jgi:uncharacterized RDD family membrane protein YckC